MKNILFLFFLFLGIQKVQSQLIVMNDKMNIVYYGVDNPISFSVNGYDSKQLILKASCGELRKTVEGYVWKICGEKGSTVSFSCSLKKDNKIIHLGLIEYRIKKVPNPIFICFSYFHGQSSPHIPIKINYTRAELNDFDFHIRFHVTQFDLELYTKNGDTLSYHILGAKLSEETRLKVANLKEGEQLCIKNVFVKNDCELEDRKLDDNWCVVAHE